MEAKYKEIRQRLKEHMEDSNGKGCWNKYYGSILEADIINFVEKEVKKLNIDDVSNCSCINRDTLTPEARKMFDDIDKAMERKK